MSNNNWLRFDEFLIRSVTNKTNLFIEINSLVGQSFGTEDLSRAKESIEDAVMKTLFAVVLARDDDQQFGRSVIRNRRLEESEGTCRGCGATGRGRSYSRRDLRSSSSSPHCLGSVSESPPAHRCLSRRTRSASAPGTTSDRSSQIST